MIKAERDWQSCARGCWARCAVLKQTCDKTTGRVLRERTLKLWTQRERDQPGTTPQQKGRMGRAGFGVLIRDTVACRSEAQMSARTPLRTFFRNQISKDFGNFEM